MSPKFSITLCTFNSLEYIGDCINSLLNQTLQDFELIIVDDGSTDGTVDYLRGLSDHRIKLLVLNSNFGLIYARTQAFQAACGIYIALMDSDDIAHPERLAQQLEVLERGDVGICATRYQTLETSTQRLRKRKSFVRNPDIRALMSIYCPICNPTASFKRELLNVTGYSDEFRHAEDYAFWTALSAANCVFYIIPSTLLTYRIHPQQVSRVRSAEARDSFLKAQQRYVTAVLGLRPAPESMPLTQRLRSGLKFMLTLNRRLPGVSVAANYEIYGEFQYRGNGWRTPFLRLERLLIAMLGSVVGRLHPA